MSANTDPWAYIQGLENEVVGQTWREAVRTGYEAHDPTEATYFHRDTLADEPHLDKEPGDDERCPCRPVIVRGIMPYTLDELFAQLEKADG